MQNTAMTRSADDTRLRQRARLAARLCTIAAMIVPVLALIGFIAMGPRLFLDNAAWVPETAMLGLVQVVIALGVGMVGPVLIAVALFGARRFFEAAGRGDWFSQTGAGAVRRFGALYAAAGLMALLTPALLSPVLTWQNGAGERLLVLSVSSTPLMHMLVGFMIWLMGDVMQRAVALAEDNRQII